MIIHQRPSLFQIACLFIYGFFHYLSLCIKNRRFLLGSWLCQFLLKLLKRYTAGYPNNDSELVIFDVSWIGNFLRIILFLIPQNSVIHVAAFSKNLIHSTHILYQIKSDNVLFARQFRVGLGINVSSAFGLLATTVAEE